MIVFTLFILAAINYICRWNIELLSRYGSAGNEAQLDKLGGVAWQARLPRAAFGLWPNSLSRLRRCVMFARRTLIAEDGSFGEFCARFAFTETEPVKCDQ